MPEDRPIFSTVQKVAVAGFVLATAAAPITGRAQTQQLEMVPSDTVLFSSPEMLETWLELDRDVERHDRGEPDNHSEDEPAELPADELVSPNHDHDEDPNEGRGTDHAQQAE